MNDNSNPSKILFVRGAQPHEFQDRTYGKNMRVCNPRPKKSATEERTYRDTVSGAIVTSAGVSR